MGPKDPFPPLAGCVILSSLLNLFVPQLPHLEKEDKMVTYRVIRVKRSNTCRMLSAGPGLERRRKVKVLAARWCPTLYDPMDCSPPGSSVHGILQARILEWAAILFLRGSS